MAKRGIKSPKRKRGRRIWGKTHKQLIVNFLVGLLLVFVLFYLWKPDFTLYHIKRIVYYGVSGKKMPDKLLMDQNYIWGIDISHHQGHINWEKLAAVKPGFIFMKATEGTTHTDTRFKEYWRNAKKFGISRGAYHFFSFQSGGKEQAQHFIKKVTLIPGDLPPVLDVEFSKKMPSNEWVTTEIKSWLTYVEAHYAIKPIIYVENDFFYKYLHQKIDESYILWICDFWGEPQMNWTFWQQTDNAQLNGIKKRVDYNVFSGTLNQLELLKLK